MFFPTYERIKSIGTRHAGKFYTPEGFTRLLRRQFKDPNLRFTTRRDPMVTNHNFWIEGEYRPASDEDDEPCIFLTLIYPGKKRKIKINDVNWENIGFHLADVITHEYLHQYYIRKRKFRYGKDYRVTHSYRETMKDYLGQEDEVLAHAFNVASEVAVYGVKLEKTNIYKLYQRYFRRDQKVLLQLKTQAVKYLKRLENTDVKTDSRNRRRAR
jgi:hypothetical protein